MLGNLLRPDIEKMIRDKDWKHLRQEFAQLDPSDLAEILEEFPLQDAALVFRILPRDAATMIFEYLPLELQTQLVQSLADEQLVNVVNAMAPDDRTRLLEELPPEVTRRVLASLTPSELKTARQLLGYPEDSAGRYMTPEYVAVRPDMTAQEALTYIRKHGKGAETLNVIYVTDEKGRLLSDLKLAALVMSDPSAKVEDLDPGQLFSIPATADREEFVAAFEKYDRVALPVTDSKGIMLGIITIDDVLDVAEEEATEDIQKLGGMQALEAPYMDSPFLDMVKKRAGWLLVLFFGEMFTATAMAYFEGEIKRAVVLALFIPLIISSGGNSGSQATSLIIRSLAVRELELSDWMRVMKRELLSGLALGSILGAVGFLRIVLWPSRAVVYGAHYIGIGVVVAISLVGVVLFGTLAGSMLPFLLRRLGLDPATASAPFVATLVDVSGLIIYFSAASLVLRGLLL
ncbi:MAG TPA: magnesium transporter [Pseudomonadota bacterium]|jgi:magnesium transporter|nr:magnesium transporter [Pseudomonadota bacterium]